MNTRSSLKLKEKEESHYISYKEIRLSLNKDLIGTEKKDKLRILKVILENFPSFEKRFEEEHRENIVEKFVDKDPNSTTVSDIEKVNKERNSEDSFENLKNSKNLTPDAELKNKNIETDIETIVKNIIIDIVEEIEKVNEEEDTYKVKGNIKNYISIGKGLKKVQEKILNNVDNSKTTQKENKVVVIERSSTQTKIESLNDSKLVERKLEINIKMSDCIQKILNRKDKLSKDALLGILVKQKELLIRYEGEILDEKNFLENDKTEKADQAKIATDLVNRVWEGLETYINNVRDDLSGAPTPDANVGSNLSSQSDNLNGSFQTNTNSLSSIPKTFKLDSNTPIFKKMNGEVSIEDWILTIETNMRLANVPNNLMVPIALSYLKNTAFTIAKSHLNGSTWEKLTDELRGVFTPFDEKRKIKNLLNNLKQTDSFEKYLDKFHELSYQLKLSEPDSLEYFLNGLKDKTRYQLIREKGADTLKDAIQNAASISKSEPESLHTNSAIARKLQCSYCKKLGHVASQCRILAEKNRSVKTDNRNSFNKNKVYQNNQNSGNSNFKERNKFNKTPQTNQKTNKTLSNVIVCHNCKKVGHKKNECRKLLKQNVAIVDQVDNLYNSESQSIKCNVSLCHKITYEEPVDSTMEVESFYDADYFDYVRQFTEENNEICKRCGNVGHNGNECKHI